MTIKLALSAAIISAFSLAAGGCLYYPNESDRSGSSTYGSSSTSGTFTQVGEAEMLQGSLSNVTAFSASSPELRISSSASFATVRIDALNSGARWWAMNRLSITGGLGHRALRVGAHLTFTPTSTSNAGLRVSVLGCSGPARDNYTYDRTAQSVTVDVLPGSEEGCNRMVFTAVFVNGSERQQVQGSFEYEPR